MIPLDSTPSGDEELVFFENPPESLEDKEWRIRLEGQKQDQSERLLFHDRAFFVTMIWVLLLVALPIVQMIFSIWGVGLSDGQFITVVTTTTAAIFGFWTLVGKYLFRDGKN